MSLDKQEKIYIFYVLILSNLDSECHLVNSDTACLLYKSGLNVGQEGGKMPSLKKNNNNCKTGLYVQSPHSLELVPYIKYNILHTIFFIIMHINIYHKFSHFNNKLSDIRYIHDIIPSISRTRFIGEN